jgi:hypothetical protein
MKVMIMKHLVKFFLLAAISITSLSAYADTTQTLSIGALPSTVNFGNSYNRASNTGPFMDVQGNAFSGTTFYDDFIFTIPDGTANSLTSSISFGDFFGIDNLRARIYTGSTHQTGVIAAGERVVGWGSTAVLNSFASLTTVVLEPTLLTAGTYTLQIKGDIVGSNGGSYSSVLNVTAPVPEAESYGMLIAGLSLVSVIARRKSKKAY